MSPYEDYVLELKAENAKLRAEVEHLKGPFTCKHDPQFAGGACAACHAEWIDKAQQLNLQVDELKSKNNDLTKWYDDWKKAAYKQSERAEGAERLLGEVTGLIQRYAECVGQQEGVDFIDCMDEKDRVQLHKLLEKPKHEHTWALIEDSHYYCHGCKTTGDVVDGKVVEKRTDAPGPNKCTCPNICYWHG